MSCCGYCRCFTFGDRNEDDIVDDLDDTCVGGEHDSLCRDLYGEPNHHTATQRVGQSDNDGVRISPRRRARYPSQVGCDQHLAGCHALTEF